jgi:peptidoglycan/xylan/chitin deacetylase (PgdA/CDA1 family)
MRALPILMFHSVSEAPPRARTPSLYLSPERFRAYLGHIARLGFRGVSMGQASRRWLGGGGDTKARERLVVLTFDDGFADNYEEALPILQEYGFTATCYVATDYLGGHNEWDADVLGIHTPMMTRHQLRAWRDAGMEVGAHTRSHCDLSADADGVTLREEIGGSKADLEDLLGSAIDHFSYPFGRYHAAAVAAVREAGFSTAVTVRDRRARATDDRFELPRLYVGGTYPMPYVLARWFSRLGDWTFTAP